jgi:glycosyltransferase involved in cell wall biosynthesis
MVDISIVIPTYNNLNLFKQCLASILEQKGVLMEIIVVDDSSSAIIGNYIKKLGDNRIKYFQNIPRKGAVKNWNYGLNLAKGKYITVLHHDEYYYDSINQLFQIIHCNPGFDVFISSVLIQRPEKTTYSLKFSNHLKKYILKYFPSYLMFHNIIGPVSCIIFKNDILTQFNESLVWYVDVEWYVRLIKNHKVKFLKNQTIVSILTHPQKITEFIDIRKEMISDYNKLKRNYSKFSKLVLLVNLNILFKEFKAYMSAINLK